TVLEKNFENSNLLEQVSVSTLQKGVYLAVLKTDKKNITKKIIIN
ncbi:T9SS type A sorting domain-containing protein, partial [Flavobacterium sp.]